MTSDFEAVARLGLFLLASGVALGTNTVALSTQLGSLTFDRDAFANTIAVPVNGINQGLAMIMEAAEAANQNVVDLSARLASTFVGVLQNIGSFASQVPNFIANTLVPFLTDTASGISNAVLDYLQSVPGTLFDLGRTLTFTDLNPFTSAYAAALTDRSLAPELRTALEQAQDIVHQAGQTVVVQTGIGTNPFNGAGFNPDAAPPAAVNLNEGQLRTFSINLPFEAGVGGQRLQLTLAGPNASTLTVLTDGVTLTPQNGSVLLTIPEGQRQLLVGLRSIQDITISSSLTVSAALLDANNAATHTTHLEANVALAETGELATSELPVQGPVEFVFNNQYIFDGVWGNEQVSGTGLGDNLWGQLGDDRLYGLDGTDFLSGGWGRDALYGGNHQDWLQGDWSEQFGAQGPQEQDYLDGGAGDDTLLGYGNDDVLLGGDDADQLLGDDYPQSPGARPVGKDYLDGGAGNDLLFAGLGEDVLFGGDGADELWGDNMPEGGWNDIITDQNGFLVSVFDPTGRPGRFTPDGGADYLDGGAGSDLLRGEGGDDVLLGGADNDFLFGDDQSTFTVTPGADWLDGGAGDDLLNGGRGTDALFGGEGNDLLFGDSADPSIGDDDTLDGGAGDDELQGGGGHDLLEGGLGNDFLLGQDGDDSLYGGEGLDELQGGVGADVLDGGADNDLVVGQAGNDTLFGGDGADELQGGEGDDDLAGETGDDFLLGDAGQDSLFGGDGADRLQGGIGDDLIVGDAGNDGLYGEDGDDTYIVDDANDRVIEAALGGNDTVASTVSYTLSRHVEQLILQGEHAITGNWYRLGKISIDRILMHA